MTAAATLTYMPAEHVPVLAAELVDLLDPAPGETAIDCTFGGGGHARLVAERIGPGGTLIAIDRDPAARERFDALQPELECESRFAGAAFDEALGELLEAGMRAHAVYLDLGISSLQVDAWQRGFSYAYDAPLDMRMDPTQSLTAREVVNEWPEARLGQLIREYGEERRSGRIAAEIVRRRPLSSTSELAEAIKSALPPAERFARGHPAKRTFQAIRIAVNDELGALDRALPLAWDILEADGRLAAISFHSLEDRRVKRFLADRARGCVCPPEFPVCTCGRTPEAELLTRGAMVPGADEVAANPRAGSARLRAARKLADTEAR